MDQASATQEVTHLQHKVQFALQDRIAAHQLLQKRLHLVETRMTGWEKLQDSLTTMQEDLSTVQDVHCQLLATVTNMGELLDTLVNTKRLASPFADDDKGCRFHVPLVKNGPFYPWGKNGGIRMRKVLQTG